MSPADVCLWHKADIATVPSDVCFRGDSGHCDEAAKAAWRIAANIAKLPSLLPQ
jgi:hypothetical protein